MESFLLLLLASAVFASASAQPPVGVYGAMRRIMQDGNLSAAVSLDTLDRTHLYALGPVAGLQGEIAVVDGRVYVARRGDNGVDTTSAPPAAAVLVYSRVKRWAEVPLRNNAADLAAVQSAIEAAAARQGLGSVDSYSWRSSLAACGKKRCADTALATRCGRRWSLCFRVTAIG